MRRPTGRWAMVAAVTVALLLSGCGGPEPPQAAAPPVPSRLVEPATFAAVIADHPDAPVVNVHVPYEGHIAGTTDFVPYDAVDRWDRLPAERDRLIVLYCRSGTMSAQAATALAAKGYSNIVDLGGGMHAWTASGRTLAHDGPA